VIHISIVQNLKVHIMQLHLFSLVRHILNDTWFALYAFQVMLKRSIGASSVVIKISTGKTRATEEG
jgi:hypothetical protein